MTETTTTVGGNAVRALVGIVERLERLAEEKQGIADDMREVFAEAKSDGFDTATIRRVLRYRAMDPAKRQEQQAIMDTYLAALDEA